MRISIGVILLGSLCAACGGTSSPAGDAGVDQAVAAADLTIAVDMLVLPSVPTAVTATANIDTGARLAWTEPASGGPVTGYTVTSSPAGGTVEILGTRAIVAGLTVGQSYTFTVKASNATGDGPDSAPSNSVAIVAGPAAPAAFIACGADQLANLSATPLAGAASYKVYYGIATGISRLSANVLPASALPFVHTGLTNTTKLYYAITAVDAAGVESALSTEDNATPDSVVHDSLYAHSYSATPQSIEIIDCFSKYATGATPAGRLIKGTNTTINTYYYNNIAVDPQRALIYYRNPSSILVFAHATTATGDIAPSRTITNAGLVSAGGMALDTTRDILYVGTSATSILAFANISTATGSTAPTHTITGANTMVGNMHSISIDTANDILYVDNGTSALVFNGASTATGNIAPSRTFTMSGTTLASYGVAVDPTNDVLYLSSRDTGMIHSVTASTATGSTTALHAISGLSTPMGLVTANNRLFMVMDNGSTKVLMWNAANTVTGAVAADRIINFPTLTAAGGIAYAP